MAEARRKSIALKDKLSIVNYLESAKKTQAMICRERNLSKSTVATIWANRSKLKNSVEDGASSSSRKRMRGAKHEDLDSALYRWFVQARERKVYIYPSQSIRDTSLRNRRVCALQRLRKTFPWVRLRIRRCRGQTCATLVQERGQTSAMGATVPRDCALAFWTIDTG